MPTVRTPRAASTARTQILTDLKDDHQRFKKAYRAFQKLDPHDDIAARVRIVDTALSDLTIHAAVEEELLYPAARRALADADLVDEAEVEHGALHALMDRLRVLAPTDEMYTAHFTVLYEYVLHHVKEEEGQMFPQLAKAGLDWESLANAINARREALMTVEPADAVPDDVNPAADPAGVMPSARVRTSRSTSSGTPARVRSSATRS